MSSDSSRLIVVKSARYRPGCEPTRTGFNAYVKQVNEDRQHREAVVNAVVNGLPIPVKGEVKSSSSKVDISNEVTF